MGFDIEHFSGNEEASWKEKMEKKKGLCVCMRRRRETTGYVCEYTSKKGIK